ncbi:hypothetical protein CRUP_012116 [Coryphaenoides rupestris]|nr:hypothetical protein CRUP_012116 [Coryphaenoides rupestris]
MAPCASSRPKFPSELETRMDKQQFEETVRTLNNLYAEAEKLGGQSYLEGCLACLTAYTVFLCMETHYEKVLKKIAKYIQEQNDKIYAPRGLLLTDPIERGLRVKPSGQGKHGLLGTDLHTPSDAPVVACEDFVIGWGGHPDNAPAPPPPPPPPPPPLYNCVPTI